MQKTISPRQTWKWLQAGACRLVDIREPDEIEAVSVVGAESAPLSVIRRMAIPPSREGLPIVYACHSGRRVQNNALLLDGIAKGEHFNMEGGMAAWIREGLPVRRGRRISLERQVRMGAGGLVLAGLALACAHPAFLAVPAFVGCGLVYAGVTGTCGLGLLLQKMPWNRESGR